VGPLSKLEFVRAFPRVFKGTHLSHPQVESLTAERVTIDCDEAMDCYADGERCGPLPATVQAVPQALSVLVPPRGARR
jgi:diacylglycerol kinase (ATP)